MTLAELLAQQQAAQQAQPGLGPRINAQTQSVDLRPQQGETQEAYRARVEASRGLVQESPGTQLMNSFAEAAMSATGAPPPQRQVGVVEDVLRSGAAGVARGTVGLAGLPGTVRETMTGALEGVGVPPNTANLVGRAAVFPFSLNPSGEDLMPVASTLTGGMSDYQPQTTAGEYARTAGEFLPGGAAAKAPMIYGVVPGLASEWAGQQTEGTAWEMPARVGAATVAPGATQAAISRVANPGALSRAVYGSATDPSAERNAAAALLERYGVPMTAGQRLGDDAIFRREMLTGAGRRLAEEQTEGFTRAVLSTIGETATRATPDVMAAAQSRIGGVFESLQRNTAIPPTVLASGPQGATLVDKARNVASVYADSVASQSPIIGRIADDLGEAATNGADIPAATLMRWRSIVSGMSRSPDAATREAAIGMREILDDGLEQTLVALNRSDDVTRLAEARTQYRNFLALVRATSGAGSNTAEGLISPSQLRSAVAAQDRAAYVTGNRGEIGELARAGETILKLPPNSGTPAGLRAMVPPEAMTGIGAATLGGSMDLPALAALGLGVVGAGAPAVYRNIGMTRTVQNALAQTGRPPLLMPGYVNSLAGFAAP